MAKSLRYGLGLLDYTDDSPHIILRLPLTSNDTAGIGNANVIGTGASTFDSVLGYKPYYTDGVSNAPANGNLTFDAASNPIIPANLLSKVLSGYTISFEVQTSVLLSLSHTVVFTSLNPVTAAAEIRGAVASTGVVVVNNSTRLLGDTTGINYLLGSERASDDDWAANEFTRVTYSVSTGGKFDIFWGKKWMCSGKFAAALVSDTNPLDTVTLGGYVGGETFPGYIRNLMVIDKPVSWQWDKAIGRIALCGDSITQQGNNPYASNNYPFSASLYGAISGAIGTDDYCIPAEMFRRFAENDRYVQTYGFAVGGSKIYNSGTRILDQLDGTATAQVRDFRPDVLIIAGGTNDNIEDADMTDSGGTSFGAGYRETLDEALSWGFIKGIVLANIPTLANKPSENTAGNAAATITGNATIDALAAEYANSYPNVKFTVADRCTAFGGAVPIVEYFAADDLHLSTIGHYVQSKVYYDAVVALGL